MKSGLATFLLIFSLAITLNAQPKSQPAAPASQSTLSYKITLTDLLRIDVYQEDDLRTLSRVDVKGNINLPLVSEVHLVGLSVSEAQKVVEAAYRDGRFLRNPQVTINVESYAAREVSIQGEVRAPGRFPLPIETSMTVLDLVTRAGGFTPDAKSKAVTLTRISSDGKKEVFTIDVESLINGKANSSNINDNARTLEPGDIVYVPQRII